MGSIFCCFRRETSTPKQTNKCFINRLLDVFGEESLMARLLGKRSDRLEIETSFKQLSFYDFNEEKSSLLGQTPGMNFESDGDETESDIRSVDEGAIAVLTMEEIRNMKDLELDYEKKKQLMFASGGTDAFVKINNKPYYQDLLGNLEIEYPEDLINLSDTENDPEDLEEIPIMK